MSSGSDVAKLQHQIRQNANELHRYVQDVHEWQKQCEDNRPPGRNSGPTRAQLLSPKVNIDAIREKGNVQFRSGKYAAAIRTYTECLEHDPNNSKALANRAAASMKLNQFADVERDCTAALAHDPQNLKILLRRGTARAALQKTYSAILDFEDIVRRAEAGTSPEIIAQNHLKTLRAKKPPPIISSDQIPAEVKSMPRRRLIIEEISDEESEFEDTR